MICDIYLIYIPESNYFKSIFFLKSKYFTGIKLYCVYSSVTFLIQSSVSGINLCSM